MLLINLEGSQLVGNSVAVLATYGVSNRPPSLCASASVVLARLLTALEVVAWTEYLSYRPYLLLLPYRWTSVIVWVLLLT